MALHVTTCHRRQLETALIAFRCGLRHHERTKNGPQQKLCENTTTNVVSTSLPVSLFRGITWK